MLKDHALLPALPASDLERAIRFYDEKLGLRPITVEPGLVHYKCGNARFVVFPTPYAGTAQHTLAGWEVGDVERDVRELQGRGITFEEYDEPGFKTVRGIATVGGELAAWFKDSEGNLLSITQLH
jgi:catechol 2,3-dioxygenase-like lactoylglutathione lyase family enzyme